MQIRFFNYSVQFAEGYWDRWSFLRNWWRIDARDPLLAPPHYARFYRELVRDGANPHLSRLDPLYVTIEALSRRSSRKEGGGFYPPQLDFDLGALEVPVAAAAALRDLRRNDGAAYLALLRCANDAESLERLMEALAGPLAECGCQRLVGPTGLSPYLESGVLEDGWDQVPPQFTAYNPPHLPETVASLLSPLAEMRLLSLMIPPADVPPADAPGEVVPIDPQRLGADLFPLFSGAFFEAADGYAQASDFHFPPPDIEETRFLLRWLSQAPLTAFAVLVEEQPAGFILLCPDLAPRYRQAGGGRNLFWRAWLAYAARRPVLRGRLLFGGVLHAFRGRGLGTQLLAAAVQASREAGWESLIAGPLFPSGSAARFLIYKGASAGQRYGLYQFEF